MSTSNDRSLGPVVVIAALVLLIAGWAYFTATERADKPAPAPAAEKPVLRATKVDRPAPAVPTTPAAVDSEATPRPADADADGATNVELSSSPPRPSATLLAAMVTQPSIQPVEQADAVRPVLEAAVEKFAKCWSDQPAATKRAEGKAFLTFSVGKGGIPTGPHLQFKGVDSQDLADCMDEVVSTVRLGEAEVGTRVFWPMVLGGSAGVATLGG